MYKIWLHLVVWTSTCAIGFAQPMADMFLPDLSVSMPHMRDMAISPDGNEMYFTLESYAKDVSVIVYIRKTPSGWTQPDVVTFSGRYRDIEPAFSMDGLKLYYASNRPLSGKGDPKDFDIWYVERPAPGQPWSFPINPGKPLNSDEDEYFPSLTKRGDLYFTSGRAGSHGLEDIFVSRWTSTGFNDPKALSDSVNSVGYEFNAYIDPDEKYILFSSYGRPDGMGGGDLYISRKNANGNWGMAKNLGPTINSSSLDYCPFVDLKNNLFYFSSNRSQLKKNYDRPLEFIDFLKEVHQPVNGLGRIYSMPLSEIFE